MHFEENREFKKKETPTGSLPIRFLFLFVVLGLLYLGFFKIIISNENMRRLNRGSRPSGG